MLAHELGLEPGPSLRDLERAILVQDPALLPAARRAASSRGSAVLLVVEEEQELDKLAQVAALLRRQPGYELIVARLLEDGGEGRLDVGFAMLRERCRSLGLPARVAAFTSQKPARDVARLVVTHEVDLVLLDATTRLMGTEVPPELARIFEESSADVAVLHGAVAPLQTESPIWVLFGGSEHDWAALEIAASLASAAASPLRLLGASGTVAGGGDASRLLADASLAVQRVLGIDAEPALASPSRAELLEAVRSDAALVAAGIANGWRRSGIGSAARALLDAARPLLLVHRGPRPGVLAPAESRTRFSWSIQG
jgi:hypothetical protein